MFSRSFFGGAFYGPRYFGDGGDQAPAAVVAETPSGGWTRAFRDESDAERAKRIYAERVKRGILAPPHPIQAAGATIAERPATLAPPDDAASAATLAELHTSAYLDAELHTSAYLDAEIRRDFDFIDDEEAIYAILALVGTLH